MNTSPKVERSFSQLRSGRISSSVIARSLLMMLSLLAWFDSPMRCQTQPAGASTLTVVAKNISGAFCLASAGRLSPLVVSSADFPAVRRAIGSLQSDLHAVTGSRVRVFADSLPAAKEIVLIGTIGRSPLIDELIHSGQVDTSGVSGKWEAFLLQVLDKPFPGVDRAFVIAGSDKRGTVYGMYYLSESIGVSPWYWWADVPVRHRPEIFITKGRHIDAPAVKYRGIFINDEAPALSGWAKEKFGGLNHQFYEKVFELILRMKGNFLWPAMWGEAFYDDDALNPELADEYGIVIGTSHHEPMMRAHDEWRRYGKGPWNYEKNDSVLKVFWRNGISRMGTYESLVTIGMRGDGDEPMSQSANIDLLERIVKDQRVILNEVTGKDPARIPQVWALYKEVQEYYDKGMRVPDDVTLLLCDDNWGNIRKLPKLSDKPRGGGYGIYYHFDYVGGPRNYKWLNTNQISRVWEQMHLAYSYGVDRLWIVNVGDIKPMEFPIQFFLSYAWNPNAWTADRLPDFTVRWAEEQFGAQYAKEIADILAKYTQYNSRRKPELLSPDTYRLVHFHEAETIASDYSALAASAQRVAKLLPPAYQDAYFQLVLHPVLACSNLNDLYVTVAKNRLAARQGRATANDLAARARKLFDQDSLISYRYNHILAGGKWNHMMDQTHIGYTYWQQPDYNSMPSVNEISLPDTSAMGVAVEGSTGWWPAAKEEARLPEFSPFGIKVHTIDVFNRGSRPFNYSAVPGMRWVHIEPAKGVIAKEQRLRVSIDWHRVPSGKSNTPVTIYGPNKSCVVINIPVDNDAPSTMSGIKGFVESDGYISAEAEHFTNAVGSSSVSWLCIPGLGRTLSGMTPVPVSSEVQHPGGEAPRLEYNMWFSSKGEVKVNTYLSPTLNFHNGPGLRFAVSFDGEQPTMINMHAGESNQRWEQWVAQNINIQTSIHHIAEPGWHTLKFWMVDPGVVVQKFVVETGDPRKSYLGPPESFRLISSGSVQ